MKHDSTQSQFPEHFFIVLSSSRLASFLEQATLETDASEDVVTPANMKMVTSFPNYMDCVICVSYLLFQVVFGTIVQESEGLQALPLPQPSLRPLEGVQRFPRPNEILLHIFPSMWFLPASSNNVHAALKVS